MNDLLLFQPLDAGDIGVDGHRVVGVIDYEARLCAVRLFDVFSAQIVDLHLFLFAPLGIVGGQARIFFA